MGVGAQGEAGVIVPQHTGDRLDVHTVLQGQCGEGMAQIVKADMFQSGILEDLLMEFRHRVRVVHLASGGRGEHIRVFRVLFVLLDQQVNRFLRNGHPAHRGLGLGPGEGECAAGILDVLLADGDRPALDVQVIPEKSYQFAFPQATYQLQIEYGEHPSGIGGIQIGFQMLGAKGFHLYLLYLGGNAVVSWIAGDEPLLHCPFECAVEHEVDAADCGAAETGIAVAAPMVDTAMLHQILVELLEIPGGQFFEFNFSNVRCRWFCWF